MNEELIKYIKLFLNDGFINEKEKEIIYRKSKDLGVPIDECQVILNSLVFEVNSNKKQIPETKSKVVKRSFVEKTFIKTKPATLDQKTKLSKEIKNLEKSTQNLTKEAKVSLNSLEQIEKEIDEKKVNLNILIAKQKEIRLNMDELIEAYSKNFNETIFEKYKCIPVSSSGPHFSKKNRGGPAATIILENDAKKIIHKYFQSLKYDNTHQKNKHKKRYQIGVIFGIISFGLYILYMNAKPQGTMLWFIPTLIPVFFASYYHQKLKAQNVGFSADDVEEILKSLDKNFDYSYVKLLRKANDEIISAQKLVRKNTDYDKLFKVIKNNVN